MTKEVPTQNNCDECLKKIKNTIKVVLITALSIIGTAVITFNAIRLSKLEKAQEEQKVMIEKINLQIEKINIAVFNIKE